MGCLKSLLKGLCIGCAYAGAPFVVGMLGNSQTKSAELGYRKFQKPFTMAFISVVGGIPAVVFNRPTRGVKSFILVLIPSLFLVLATLCTYVAVVRGTPSVCFLVSQIAPIIAIDTFPPKNRMTIFLLLFSVIFLGFAHLDEFKYFLLDTIGVIFKYVQSFAEKKLSEVIGIPQARFVFPEAIWSTLTIGLIILPLAYGIPGSDVSSIYGGSVENFADSLLMVFKTPLIAIGFFTIPVVGFANMSINALIDLPDDSLPCLLIRFITVVGMWLCLLLTGGAYTTFSIVMQVISLVVILLSYTIPLISLCRSNRRRRLRSDEINLNP